GADYTTCGALPRFVLFELGAAQGFGWGVLGLRDDARKQNLWVVADQDIYEDDEARPLPGDLYGLVQGSNPEVGLDHVGVIVDSRPSATNVWVTADAGQGGLGQPQEARFVKRRYNPKAGTLSGPLVLIPGKEDRAELGAPRLLAGWVDLEKLKVTKKL
ncbi:MAG: hypothetical protein ACRC33_24555, partial [Gemmataceae bacterium]